MSWEKRRNGKVYQYRSVRFGAKVRKIYLGSGDIAWLAAHQHEQEKALRQEIQSLKLQLRKQAERSGKDFDRLLRIPLHELAIHFEQGEGPFRSDPPVDAGQQRTLTRRQFLDRLATGWMDLGQRSLQDWACHVYEGNLEPINSFLMEVGREVKQLAPPDAHPVVRLCAEGLLLADAQLEHALSLRDAVLARERTSQVHWDRRIFQLNRKVQQRSDMFTKAISQWPSHGIVQISCSMSGCQKVQEQRRNDAA